ncbi:MAG: hypothetical protein ABH803_03285 [Candidatus Micrarchaeota archaeon]
MKRFVFGLLVISVFLLGCLQQPASPTATPTPEISTDFAGDIDNTVNTLDFNMDLGSDLNYTDDDLSVFD